jgi:type II secretion system protein I
VKSEKLKVKRRKTGLVRKGIKTYNPLSLSNGFTLLEILVALAILATAVTIIFQLFSASLRNISVSEDVVAASVRAEAKMREVLSREELSADSWTEDTNDGYKFTVNITETLQQKTDSLPLQLLQINITISWIKNSKERSIHLKTYKTVNRKV